MIEANLSYLGSSRDIVVFILVAYLLNMICLNLLFFYRIVYVYRFSYKFDNKFFLEPGTLYITLKGLDQLLKCSGFSLYLL